ncbi:murein hydrolase activator EnvC family protein [Dethiobacter alkaliphilus]|uniref:Peptidase M23 n=1 Tax=Dethiobacter alkaliphilus AHT 1 TaxID=555088 RepID=C0GF93_DETAL|nr:M23 family metallopeptidase [Dethiobacter alkaliphilus]EEG77853.1 Peptidase M23 [Dethiobacter alkaliphilus AHT 1]
MSKVKAGIVLLLVVLLLGTGILPVFANQISDKQQELDSVRGGIDDQKKELQQNKEEQERVEREIRRLEAETRVIQAELRSIGNQISATEAEIEKIVAELADAEASIKEMDQVMAVRLRAMHENGAVSYLDVLFSSSSFGEFLTRYNDLQLIIAEDKAILTELREERARIVAMKEELEGRRQELELLRRENIAKRTDLEKKQAEQQRLASALEEAFREMDEAVSSMEAEAKQLEETIKQLQAAAARASAPASRGTGQMVWPVPEYGPAWITSRFGTRVNPITGAPGAWHGGVDIAIPHSRYPRNRSGAPVNTVAADSGVAYIFPDQFPGQRRGYGNLVIVDHGGGVATAYAHLARFHVSNGETVGRGQPLGVIGSTGASTGPHLHFEVRINGERVNPLPYIQ